MASYLDGPQLIRIPVEPTLRILCEECSTLTTCALASPLRGPDLALEELARYAGADEAHL